MTDKTAEILGLQSLWKPEMDFAMRVCRRFPAHKGLQ